MINFGRLVVGLGLFSMSSIGIAATAADKTEMPGMDPVSMTSLIQVVLGLAVILALILGGALLLRRFGYWQISNDGVMKVVAGLPIGPREKILLLQIGEKQIVVGITPGRMETLCEMDEKVTLASGEALPTSAFQRKLMQLIQKGGRNSVQ